MKLKRSTLLTGGGILVASAATSFTASAQSSVTLYGLIDVGIGYVNHVAATPAAIGASKVQAASGIGSGTRWGLRGNEDLGGGNAAIFVLENGFNIFNGTSLQGAREFGRQAYVGLTNQQFGSITFGRQYDSVVDFVSPLTSAKQWATQYGAHVGDIDNLYNSFRIDNAIKYTSPSMKGLTVSSLYGFSNQASGSAGTGFANNRAWSAGASYANGPLSAAAGYLHLNNPSTGNTGGTNTDGAIAGDYTSATDIFYAQPVRTQDVVAAGLGYRLGTVAVNFVYSHARLDYTNNTSLTVSTYEANSKYSITPALVAGLALIYSDGSLGGASRIANVSTGKNPRWGQVNMGVDYALSKRSETYVAAIYQKAMGDATVAAIDNVGGPSGSHASNQLALIAGLRHKF
ncbi:porin [Paraburkholderia agricolaris]|uniref:porin n=1 Tax=Paraburkholderia agricolaris TaxID=2152888 RepID=UPI0038BCB836